VQRNKVLLLGTVERTLRLAPIGDPAYEVWGLNNMFSNEYLRDADGKLLAHAWFDLHEWVAQSASDIQGIESCPVPIYLCGDDADRVPNGIRYPIDEVRAALPFAEDYYTCTFAYQIALALCLGYQTIGLYGIELAWGREGLIEKPCVEYWIGVAQARGVTIEKPAESVLCNHAGLHYGFDYLDEKELVEHCLDQFLLFGVMNMGHESSFNKRIARMYELRRNTRIIDDGA